MTSSRSCSSSFALAVAGALLLAPAVARPQSPQPPQSSASGALGPAAAGSRVAAGGAPPLGAGPRIALFPLENLAGTAAPLRELRGALEASLARAGLRVVAAETLDAFLTKHRVRYTGGVESGIAKSAGEELGVSAIVLAALEGYAPDAPRLALTMRAVGAREEAPILWIDGLSRAGDESPGFLGLGLVRSPVVLQEQIFSRLSGSLAAALAGKGPLAGACEGAGRFRPKVRYRSALLSPGRNYSVAVVPFRSFAKRRNAGDLLALELLRQQAATQGFRVIEPGVVREVILKHRIVMEGGVSLDQVRTLVGALGADLVIAGDVFELDDAGSVPVVSFTASMLDARTGDIVWQASAYARGDEGLRLFGTGIVRTAPALACRVLRTSLDELFDLKAFEPIERRASEPAKKGGWKPREGGAE